MPQIRHTYLINEIKLIQRLRKSFIVGSGGACEHWPAGSATAAYVGRQSGERQSVNLTHVARSAAQDALNTIFKLTFTGQRKAA